MPNRTMSFTTISLWGMIVVLIALSMGLIAYYTHFVLLRYVAFFLILCGLGILFAGMMYALKQAYKSLSIAFILTVFLFIAYFLQRTALHHFDFGVGDASDYYIAGVCSVTYDQDIGFFLPLTASVSAIGYTIFGSAYAPLMNVILYAASVPVSYILFKKLGLRTSLSFVMSFFLVCIPLSIWFSKTSFSEPVWQLMLLLFTLVAYRLSSKEHVDLKDFIALFLIVMLVPFLRGEAVLYYGLIIFLALYHFWRYNHLKSALLIASSLVLLALSIHLTLHIRAHYLLQWQFSRIIPNITETVLMSILYTISLLAMGSIFFLHRFKKRVMQVPLPIIITILAILSKVIVASIYATKKHLIFQNLFFFNEFGFALGNFGMPFALLIILGISLLHLRAIQGDGLSLLLVVMYAIFYLPFVMQGATFQDPHELFLYWNRYYFSIFMIIHIFSLSLVIKLIYDLIGKMIKTETYTMVITIILMGSLTFFSMDYKLHRIVTNEAYLENSYKLFPWVSEHVGRYTLSVVYDSNIRYKRHNGEYDAKVFVARAFTVFKINAKTYQKIKPTQLTTQLKFTPDISQSKYLLCLSSQKCDLKNKELILLASTIFPISWREHYRAQPVSKEDVQTEVTKSLKNNIQLHATLYKIRR